MARRVKKRAAEKLTESNIEHVISLLEQEKPITKKEACAILNISYNTTRLNNIIEEHKSDKEYRQKRRAEKRGRPIEDSEVRYIAEAYLEGTPVSDIAKRIFRSASLVKSTIERVGIPNRPVGAEKDSTSYVPEQCVAEEFEPGEVAWSAKYHKPCEIKERLPNTYNDKYGTNCYKVWIREEVEHKDNIEYFLASNSGGWNAFVPSYDLGKLSHLKQYGVNLSSI